MITRLVEPSAGAVAFEGTTGTALRGGALLALAGVHRHGLVRKVQLLQEKGEL